MPLPILLEQTLIQFLGRHARPPCIGCRESLARRLSQFEEMLQADRMRGLFEGHQRGFSSTAEGNLLSEDDQWAKLRLVNDTARRVWG
jgi:hypothetical protein